MNETDRPVGILGGGSWGTTLAEVVARHGGRPLLWARNEEVLREIEEEGRNARYLDDTELSDGIETTPDLEEVAGRARLILVAIPTKGMREVSRRIGDHLTGDRMLVSCAKGIEKGTFRRMTEVMREETCAKMVGALSGPNLSVEILDGQPAGSVVASRFPRVVDATTDALMGSQLRVYGSSDVIGVEVAGALKNIIALAAGIAEGLGFGDNSKATLITRGLAEITRYGVEMGAEPLTFSGLAGVGDLLATCASPLSRNHRVGRRLGQGEALGEILDSMVQVAEGVDTTRAIRGHARSLGIEMPITGGVHRILDGGDEPLEVVEDLMARPPSREHDESVASGPG